MTQRCYLLGPGQVIVYIASAVNLPILFQDSDLIVINKPAGLLVHRTGLDRYETQFAMQLLRDQIGSHVFPVHRLDRPTSGALVFARSSEMAREMAVEFAERRVHKKYLAVVRGAMETATTVDHPLREEHDDITDKQARTDKPAQDAVTLIEPLAQVEFPVFVDRYPTSRYSLVRATPYTGRKHQIRRHLSHIHHPVIGDVNHGKGKHNRFFQDTFGIRRLLLACTEIGFFHPRDKSEIKIQAPLAAEFFDLLQKLNWSAHAP